MVLDAEGEIVHFGVTLDTLMRQQSQDFSPNFNVISLPAGPGMNRKVRMVAGGGQFAVALTVQGEVFSWGSNLHGELGIDEDECSG